MTTTAQTPASNPDVGRLKPEARSRVTNGADILPGVDGRSMTARRYRDITSQIIADQGGEGRLSEARLQLIRRFAAAAVIAEQMEAKLALGAEIDIVQNSQLASTLVRIAARIGINRILRDVSPALSDILSEADNAD